MIYWKIANIKYNNNAVLFIKIILKAQTSLRGVVAPCNQHHHGCVDNKVPELYTTRSELLD